MSASVSNAKDGQSRGSKISPIDLPGRDDLSVSGDSFTDGEEEMGDGGGYNMSKLSSFINWRKASPKKGKERELPRNSNFNGSSISANTRDTLEEEARVERDRSKFEARVILNIESAVYDTHQLINRNNDKFTYKTDKLAMHTDEIDTRIDGLLAENKKINTRLDEGALSQQQQSQNTNKDASPSEFEDRYNTRLKEVEHKNNFLAKHLLDSDNTVAEQSDQIRILQEHNKELSVRNEGYESRLARQDSEQQELRNIVSKLQTDLRGLSVLALERIQGLEKSLEKGPERGPERSLEKSLQSPDKPAERPNTNHRKGGSLSNIRDENTPSVTRSPVRHSQTPSQTHAPVRRSPASPVKQSPAIKAKAKQFT